MSAPLFLVQALPAEAEWTLDGPEGHHAANVQRLGTGEVLLLGDGAGGLAQAQVTRVHKGALDLRILDRSYVDRPSPAITVAQGIAKGDRGELAVQAMTEVGVDTILPWAASRSIARWQGDRGEKSRARWEATAREAAKQSRRPWYPEIGGTPDVSTKQLLRLIEQTPTLVLHEEATQPLSTVDLPGTGELLLIVGPEGGISPEETAAFVGAGATLTRLGPEVLRTSTAGVAAISALSVRLHRW